MRFIEKFEFVTPSELNELSVKAISSLESTFEVDNADYLIELSNSFKEQAKKGESTFTGVFSSSNSKSKLLCKYLQNKGYSISLTDNSYIGKVTFSVSWDKSKSHVKP